TLPPPAPRLTPDAPPRATVEEPARPAVRIPPGAPRMRVSFLLYSSIPARRSVALTINDSGLTTPHQGREAEGIGARPPRPAPAPPGGGPGGGGSGGGWRPGAAAGRRWRVEPPPAGGITARVTSAPALGASQIATPAMSAGSPIRPIGHDATMTSWKRSRV